MGHYVVAGQKQGETKTDCHGEYEQFIRFVLLTQYLLGNPMGISFNSPVHYLNDASESFGVPVLSISRDKEAICISKSCWGIIFLT